jgi:Mn-containing catalase
MSERLKSIVVGVLFLFFIITGNLAAGFFYDWMTEKTARIEAEVEFAEIQDRPFLLAYLSLLAARDLVTHSELLSSEEWLEQLKDMEAELIRIYKGGTVEDSVPGMIN